jgi:TPR repeat protein
MRLVMRAAELGSAEAQWRAGQVLSGRIYVPAAGLNLDRQAALGWYLRAADQGHVPSIEAMADLYTDGSDASLYSQGMELYRRAVDQGQSGWSALRMGMMYATGEGVDENEGVALDWLSRIGSDFALGDPARFSGDDLEVLSGLQASERDPSAAAESFRLALESQTGALYRPFIHSSFRRTTERMLQKLEN